MTNSRFNTFISTFNILLAIIGYQFATTLLSPLLSEAEASRIVTVPYRAFALAVSLTTIAINLKTSFKLDKVNKLLLIFWAMLIIRFFYDMHIRYDISIDKDIESRIWIFMIPMTLIPMFAVMKSYRSIDLEKLFNWVYIIISIVIVLSFFSNESFQGSTEERTGANVALNTISTGHLGLTGIILSIIMFGKNKRSWIRAGIIVISVLSGLIMFRSGSRGPLLAGLVIAALWIYSGTKNKAVNLFILAIVAAISYLIFDYILLFISDISPVLYERLMYKASVGQFDDRNPLYSYAIDSFLSSPLFGKDFAIYLESGEMAYTHNFILETFMQLGVLGGFIIIYILYKSIKKISFLITQKSHYMWLGLILAQEIMKNMVSSTFYYNSLLSILIVLLFMPLDKGNYRLSKVRG